MTSEKENSIPTYIVVLFLFETLKSNCNFPKKKPYLKLTSEYTIINLYLFRYRVYYSNCLKFSRVISYLQRRAYMVCFWNFYATIRPPGRISTLLGGLSVEQLSRSMASQPQTPDRLDVVAMTTKVKLDRKLNNLFLCKTQNRNFLLNRLDNGLHANKRWPIH